MKQVRVALSGTHGTGKTYIVENVKERLGQRYPGIRVATVESPTRYVVSLGYSNNEGTTPTTQLLSAALRVERQKVAALSGAQVVLADRCLLDELAYTEHQLDREAEGSLSSKMLDKLDTVRDATLNLFAEDVKDKFWDRIWHKKINPLFLPEADGARSGEVKFQVAVEKVLEDLPYRSHRHAIDVDRDKAADEVFAYLCERLGEAW